MQVNLLKFGMAVFHTDSNKLGNFKNKARSTVVDPAEADALLGQDLNQGQSLVVNNEDLRLLQDVRSAKGVADKARDNHQQSKTQDAVKLQELSTRATKTREAYETQQKRFRDRFIACKKPAS